MPKIDEQATTERKRPLNRGWPMSRDSVRYGALIVLTTIFGVLSVALALPFLSAITWSVALAIIAWPMHRWLERRIRWPQLAAALSTTIVIGVILAAGAFVSYRLAKEAGAATAEANGQAPLDRLQQKVSTVPSLAAAVTWLEQFNINIESEARKWMNTYINDLSGVAQGSVAAVVQFLVFTFILYYLFRDRTYLLQVLRQLLPLSKSEADQVFARAEDAVHATLYATVITALIDATCGGLMFWLLGLPAPFLWGAIIFVLSLLPIVGSGLVWVPMTIYLALTDRWFAAAALLAWGLCSFILVGNILYIRIAGERMRMHPVPALIAFLGGLAIFGMSGMILGPAIVAVTFAFLEVWRRKENATSIPTT